MEKSELLILVWNRVIKLNAPNKHKSNGSTTRASPGGVSSNGNAANQPHQRATRGQPQATRTTTQAPRPTTSTQQQPPTRSAEAKASPDNPLAGIGQDISNAFKGAVSGIGDMLNSVDESINPSNRRASGPAQGSRSGTAARSNSNTQTSNSSTANPSARSHTNTSAGTPGTTTGTGTTANTNTNANSRTSPATQTTTHPNTGTDRRSPNTRTTGGDRSSSTPANADTDKDKKTLYLLEDLHTEDQVRALNIRQLKYVLQKQHVTYAGVVERRELHDMVMRLVRQQAMDNLGLYARSPTKRTRSKPEDAGSDGRSPNDTSATSLSMGIGDDDDEDKDMCKICYERHVNCVFLECGHLVTCVDCGFQLTECPICRQFITRRVHTFRA
ncbi:hypothetical protein SARC_12152 [Sphaeroforma arctica JP610]|uniref:RING-type domain-containing protein n=1 Tax=Sphaeroforma arctica JP610 TaxID=667725 RepID=A0A0L0FEW5_9EUKA|nr:hypothetical protein SARC_12152 [Sphaeroforma arctica JP610]KNC75319.1 hypothetical protein SARC_12152 [Sphaeroforma arctica JP610]|eukprot:XP_014149221.1 hypothetical protein SARC_12152 [Sphaeroforma arctica JP610]